MPEINKETNDRVNENQALLETIVQGERVIFVLMGLLAVLVGSVFFQLRIPPATVGEKVDRNFDRMGTLHRLVTEDRWTYSMEDYIWKEFARLNPELEIPQLPPSLKGPSE